MARIIFDQVTCLYPHASEPAVDGLDLTMEDGELLALLGHEGSGKSTVLRMLAGLVTPTKGRIMVGSHDLTDRGPGDLDVAMVFQNYSLYPNLKVADNIGLPLRSAKMPKAEVRARVEEVAARLDLTDLLATPATALSPARRMRVALARSLVRRPQVLLMDEPLANLEPGLRRELLDQLVAAQAALGITTLFATDDPFEAMRTGSRIAVLDKGVLHQCDLPRALYDRPQTAFVAGLLGSPPMNLVLATVVPGGVRLGTGIWPVPDGTLEDGSTVRLGVRPEDVHVVGDEQGVPLEVDHTIVHTELSFAVGWLATDRRPLRFAVAISAAHRDQGVNKGDTIRVWPRKSVVNLFDVETGARLS